MKKIILLLTFALFMYANSENNITSAMNILKSIPKNSPQYSLDYLYTQKIRTMSYQKDKFNLQNIKNSTDFLNAFKKLASFEKTIINSQANLNALDKKINYLSSKTKPTQKLEYLYYKKLILINQDKINYLREEIPKWKKELYDKIFKIFFNVNIAKSNIKYFQTKIITADKNIEKLNIDIEKWKILNNQKNILFLKNSIKNIIQIKEQNYHFLAKNYLILFLHDIKYKDKGAFKIEHLILKYIKLYNKKYNIPYKIILNYFEKSRFGNIQLFINKTSDEIKLFFVKTWDILNDPLFKIAKKNISLINFFIFIFILIFGGLIGKYYKKSISQLENKYNINNSTITIITNIGYYLILIISFLIALKSMGLDLSSFTLIAGALSIGVGFGLQNIVSNFVSGLIIMFEKSIKIGDFMQIDNDTRGSVVDIRMRSITIRTNDNIDLIVPNQNFIQNTVTNWTLNDKSRRFRVPFGVSYGTSVEDVEKVILGALKLSTIPHYKIGDKKPLIVFTGLGNSSIDFELFVWVRDDLTLRPKRTTSEFLKMIYKALNEANITMPFPQRDLYIKEMPSQNQKNINN